MNSHRSGSHGKWGDGIAYGYKEIKCNNNSVYKEFDGSSFSYNDYGCGSDKQDNESSCQSLNNLWQIENLSDYKDYISGNVYEIPLDLSGYTTIQYNSYCKELSQTYNWCKFTLSANPNMPTNIIGVIFEVQKKHNNVLVSSYDISVLFDIEYSQLPQAVLEDPTVIQEGTCKPNPNVNEVCNLIWPEIIWYTDDKPVIYSPSSVVRDNYQFSLKVKDFIRDE